MIRSFTWAVQPCPVEAMVNTSHSICSSLLLNFLTVNRTLQLQLARSHGLPAVRLSELRSRSAELNGLHKHRRTLPASLLRDWLVETATAGTTLHFYFIEPFDLRAAAPPSQAVGCLKAHVPSRAKRGPHD